MRTISCADCGAEYETRRTNTKYCRVCRTYRDLMFLGDRSKTCIECDKQFLPLTKKDLLCGACGSFLAKAVHGDCSLCGEKTEHLLHDSIKVCRRCATDPEKRVTLLRALAKKRRKHGAD